MIARHRHYAAVKEIHQTGKLFNGQELKLWLPWELSWLAPRVMIHGLRRSDEVNRSLAQEFKRFGVQSVSMTDDVLEFWAARTAMPTMWDPEQHPNASVLDALTLFRLVPSVVLERARFRSEEEFEDMELAVGAYSLYCRHQENLKRLRGSIERMLNVFFF